MDFEHLVENNKEKIYRICRVYALPPLEPQDLFQEVLFQIWKSLPGFKGKANINTWVYRVALNVCMGSKLKLERNGNRTVRFNAIQFKATDDSSADLDEEKFILLKECIATLDEAETSLVVLYLEELAYREIGEVLGMTENHVAVKMKRIRKKLFDCINPKLN